MVVEGSDKELDPFWMKLSEQSKIDGNHNYHQLDIIKLILITIKFDDDWIKRKKKMRSLDPVEKAQIIEEKGMIHVEHDHASL